MADRLVSANDVCEKMRECGFVSPDITISEFADRLETIFEFYTVEDLREAFNEGQENECSYQWGTHTRLPWYMRGGKRRKDATD